MRSFRLSLWSSLSSAQKNVEVCFQRSIQPLGLSVLEWHVLQVLYAQDGQRMSDLAQAVGRHRTSFTSVIDRLEEKGLVKRKRSASDRRVQQVSLTRLARDRRDELTDLAAEIDRKIKAVFTEEEYQVVQRGLILLQSSRVRKLKID